jgi:methyl-accepting chemotaxis protein
MGDEYQVPPEENKTSSDSWQEVGRQFQALGESLAQTMRTAWENEETQRQVNEMRTGLESMVQDVRQAIEESANSPQGQKVRQDASRAAESLRSASEQTIQEVRPQLINALEQLNAELQKLVNRMEARRTPPADPSAPPQEGSGEPQI